MGLVFYKFVIEGEYIICEVNEMLVFWFERVDSIIVVLGDRDKVRDKDVGVVWKYRLEDILFDDCFYGFFIYFVILWQQIFDESMGFWEIFVLRVSYGFDGEVIMQVEFCGVGVDNDRLYFWEMCGVLLFMQEFGDVMCSVELFWVFGEERKFGEFQSECVNFGKKDGFVGFLGFVFGCIYSVLFCYWYVVGSIEGDIEYFFNFCCFMQELFIVIQVVGCQKVIQILNVGFKYVYFVFWGFGKVDFGCSFYCFFEFIFQVYDLEGVEIVD